MASSDESDSASTLKIALSLVPVALIGYTYLKLAVRKAIPIGEERKVEVGDLSEYDKGQHFVTAPDAEVFPKLAKQGVASMAPRTVMEQFKKAVKNCGSGEALKVERPLGTWKIWTWQDYYNDVLCAGRAMVHLGLERFGSVNIIGFNSPEWLIANVAAIAAGGKAAGIYTTNLPEACQYISEHSEGSIVVVEDKNQLAKFLKIRANLPKLKAIIQYTGDVEAGANVEGQAAVYSWADFMELGKGSNEAKLQAELDERMALSKPGHACTLIYTSGTTGNPKAVMISHDNALFTGASMLENMEPRKETEEHVVSYLPLSHIAAQMLDIYFPLISCSERNINATVWFARPDALKGTLSKTLGAARPTVFFGVPRVWEKIQEGMIAAGKATKGLKLKLVQWAKDKGALGTESGQVDGDGQLPPFYGLADKLVFSKIKAKLGLDRCSLMYTGAAPISKDTLKFFGNLGIDVLELYGMSECTGPQTICRPDYHKMGSCGPNLPGVELKIFHEQGRDKENEGEICFRGRHIMMGYMKDAAKTREAIDEKGWLHSGDVGRVDEFGMLYITGRIKELLITAGGENVAPVPVEESFKSACPAVSNCMMIGDQRKFNNLLVTLKTSPKPDGSFSNQLAGGAVDVDPSCTTVEEAAKSDKWKEYISIGMKSTNALSVSNASKVQKFIILPTDFSIPGGELGPTLKLKRSAVVEKYSKQIEAFYA